MSLHAANRRTPSVTPAERRRSSTAEAPTVLPSTYPMTAEALSLTTADRRAPSPGYDEPPTSRRAERRTADPGRRASTSDRRGQGARSRGEPPNPVGAEPPTAVACPPSTVRPCCEPPNHPASLPPNRRPSCAERRAPNAERGGAPNRRAPSAADHHQRSRAAVHGERELASAPPNEVELSRQRSPPQDHTKTRGTEFPYSAAASELTPSQLSVPVLVGEARAPEQQLAI